MIDLFSGLLRLQLLYRAYDVDGDGILGMEELKCLLHHLHTVSTHPADRKLSTEEAKALAAVSSCCCCCCCRCLLVDVSPLSLVSPLCFVSSCLYLFISMYSILNLPLSVCLNWETVAYIRCLRSSVSFSFLAQAEAAELLDRHDGLFGYSTFLSSVREKVLNATHRLMRFKRDLVAAVQQQQQQQQQHQLLQQQWLALDMEGGQTLSASSTAESFTVSPETQDSHPAAAAAAAAPQQKQQLLLLQDPQQTEALLTEARRLAAEIVAKAKSLASGLSAGEIEALLLQHNGAKQQQQQQQQQQQTCCFFATAEEALTLCDAVASLVATENSLLQVRTNRLHF